jgi:predicted CoA-binding protein
MVIDMEFMDLIKMNSFVVLGSTANKEKTAYEIKEELKKHNKKVYCVKEEYDSIEDIDKEIDVLDICMNPKYSIEYINNINENNEELELQCKEVMH